MNVRVVFIFKQKTAYEMRISDWSSDVCSSDLPMDFNGIIPGLQTRNIDVALAGITIRDDRKKVIDFYDPYYESGLAILVNKDNNAIKRSEESSEGKECVSTCRSRGSPYTTTKKIIHESYQRIQNIYITK